MLFIENEYFSWLINKIGRCESHILLLKHLYYKEFYSVIELDKNREADAIDLRTKYLADGGHIFDELANKKVSVLEVLVALALRIEEDIMHENDVGDRTGAFFWIFIRNLGLDGYYDEKLYDDINYFDKIDEILKKWMDRKYAKDGKGGLFPLKKPKKDQKTVEIWYQMQAYLLENFE